MGTRHFYIRWILLWVSLLMPVVPVMPHHHHHGDVLCLLKHTCPTDADCHHTGECATGHCCCHTGCPSRHFFQQTPPKSIQLTHHDSVQPIQALFLPPTVYIPILYKGHPAPYSLYAERLHGVSPGLSQALRAPPTYPA